MKSSKTSKSPPPASASASLSSFGLHIEQMDEDYNIRGYTFSDDQEDDDIDIEEAATKPYDEVSAFEVDPKPSPSNNAFRPNRRRDDDDIHDHYPFEDYEEIMNEAQFEAAFPPSSPPDPKPSAAASGGCTGVQLQNQNHGLVEEEEEEAPTINSGISSHVSWFALGGAGLAGQQPPPPPPSSSRQQQQQQQRQRLSKPPPSSPPRRGRVHFDKEDQEPSLAGTQSTESTPNKLMRKQVRQAKALEKHENAVSAALARRSFHLPKNTKVQDWIQYMRNTHPFLAAIGCADYKRNKVHGCGYRIIVLVTSLLVGFTAVNAAVWWSKQEDKNNRTGGMQDDGDLADNNVPSFVSDTLKIEDLFTSIPILSLFTWMTLVHAIHDVVAWYGCVTAASRNIDDGFKGLMFGMLWMFFWAGAATTFTALLFTASTDEGDLSTTTTTTTPEYDHLTERQQNDYIQQQQQQSMGGDTTTASTADSSYDYITILIYLSIEIGISWIIWYPFVVTILFSGLLGCGGCLPILGGRPRDIQIEREIALKSGGVAATLESLADYDESTLDVRPNNKNNINKKASRFM